MQKGLPVQVFRSSLAGSTGISNRFDTVVLIGDAVPQLVEPTVQMPALYLARSGMAELVAMPEPLRGTTRYAFGGNFIWSSEGHWCEIVGSGTTPLRVFDCAEGQLAKTEPSTHFTVQVDFRCGETTWAETFALELTGRIGPNVAADMVARASLPGQPERSYSGWLTHDGEVFAEATLVREVPFQAFRVLSQHLGTHRFDVCSLKAALAAARFSTAERLVA